MKFSPLCSCNMGLLNRLPPLNHAHSDPYVASSSAVRELAGSLPPLRQVASEGNPARPPPPLSEGARSLAFPWPWTATAVEERATRHDGGGTVAPSSCGVELGGHL
jgi:hypothetical protein